jgi:hypothetical protein
MTFPLAPARSRETAIWARPAHLQRRRYQRHRNGLANANFENFGFDAAPASALGQREHITPVAVDIHQVAVQPGNTESLW